MTITIEEMKKLEAAATPGPWVAKKNRHWDRKIDPRREIVAEVNGRQECIFWNGMGTQTSYEQIDSDVVFASAAREFIPWAIAEIEKLRKIVVK